MPDAIRNYTPNGNFFLFHFKPQGLEQPVVLEPQLLGRQTTLEVFLEEHKTNLVIYLVLLPKHYSRRFC